MSIVVDEEIVQEDLGSDIESVEEEQEQSQETGSSKPDVDIEKVVKEHKELQSLYGRQTQELGDLRKLTDQLLQFNNNQNQPRQEEKKKPLVDVDSLLENPEDALNRALNEHPKLKAMEQQLFQSRVSKAKEQFELDNPDWKDVVQSQNFQQWVTSSPVRLRMFQEADRNYDYNTGSELIQMYKQLNGSGQQSAPNVKAGSVERGTSARTGNTKKVYRRADLINLRINDPQKWEAMEGEIMKAYAEGRVK